MPNQPTVRGFLKKSLYLGGMTPAYHRTRNRRSLTIVMFHRVLPIGDPEWMDAEPVWTVSDVFFRACLEFFKRHYSLIGIPELLRARLHASDLPDRSLLITFDDGWADNEWCALPILRSHSAPAAVFVVAEGLGQCELWQEGIRRAFRQHRLKAEEWDGIWKSASDRPKPPRWDPTAVESLIWELAAAEPEMRSKILVGIRSQIGKPYRAQMLTVEQLRNLRAAGVTVGSHGLTHIPIPYAGDRVSEFRKSRERLASALCVPQAEINTFSFPHGIYSDETVEAAQEAGYECLFTSEKGLNAIPGRRAASALLGRLNMDQPAICGDSRAVCPEMLASWLFVRPFWHAGSASRA